MVIKEGITVVYIDFYAKVIISLTSYITTGFSNILSRECWQVLLSLEQKYWFEDNNDKHHRVVLPFSKKILNRIHHYNLHDICQITPIQNSILSVESHPLCITSIRKDIQTNIKVYDLEIYDCMTILNSNL